MKSLVLSSNFCGHLSFLERVKFPFTLFQSAEHQITLCLIDFYFILVPLRRFPLQSFQLCFQLLQIFQMDPILIIYLLNLFVNLINSEDFYLELFEQTMILFLFSTRILLLFLVYQLFSMFLRFQLLLFMLFFTFFFLLQSFFCQELLCNLKLILDVSQFYLHLFVGFLCFADSLVHFFLPFEHHLHLKF